MSFKAVISISGRLTTLSETIFPTAREAWIHLAKQRELDEDAHPCDPDGVEYCEYSTTWRDLSYIALGDHEHGNWNEDWPTGADGTGQVDGCTPGRCYVVGDDSARTPYGTCDPDSPAYDPGISYSVRRTS